MFRGLIAACFGVLLASPLAAFANDLVFGPVTCVRGTGAPTVFNYSFAAAKPSRGFVFKVYNGGLEDTTYELVSSSTVTLNGTQILGPNNFNQNVSYLEVPVGLQGQNSLAVEVRGKAGGALIIKILPIIAIDSPIEGQLFGAQPITVSGHLNSAAASVSVNGISGALSGSTFSVSDVPLAEGANTLTAIVTRADGFSGTSSLQIILDTTAPTVAIQYPPEGLVSPQDVVPGYTVFDALDQHPSVSLSPTPPFVAEGSYQFSVTATDWAGNSASATRHFTIDKTAPAVSLDFPTEGLLTNQIVQPVYSATDALDPQPVVTLAPLPPYTSEGHYQIVLTAVDWAGNQTQLTRSFTIDTTPPAIDVTSPAEGATVVTSSVTVAGSIDDALATVNVNGAVVPLSGGSFTAAGVSLVPGPNTLTVSAVDLAGNISRVDRHVTYVPTPPTVSLSAVPTVIVEGESAQLVWESGDSTSAVIDQGVGPVASRGSVTVTPSVTTAYNITVTGPGGTASAAATVTVSPAGVFAALAASPEQISVGGSTTLSWTTRGASQVVIEPGIGLVAATGTLVISPSSSTVYRISAFGSQGNATDSMAVRVEGAVPPLPKGQFGEHYQDVVPADATIAAYDFKRFALVTGRVVDQGGAALAGVRISVKNRADLGTATTAADGSYTLPVEGGGAVVLDLFRKGFLPAQRLVNVGWNDIAAVESVVLLSEDPLSTTIASDGNPARVYVHRGSVTNDEFGSRAATLAITGDTRVYAVTEAGEVELSSFELRATEYVTPETMPAVLPPESIYTYCVDLRASGLENVRFSKPAAFFVENFFSVPVGTIVPVGYYDFKLARWVASQDGRCVALLDTNGDGATDALDANGDGLPDDLDGDGSTADEAAGLADSAHYPPGATFWRAPITHLTPYDLNFPWIFAFPESAEGPNGDGPPSGDGPRDGGSSGGGPGGGGPGGGPGGGGGPSGGGPDGGDGGGCSGSGDPFASLNSYAESQGRIFHDDVDIPGADFRLHYASDRVPGYRGTITVPASGSTVPTSLDEIEVRVTVAGRVFEQKLPAATSQVTSFDWDGLDHLGRDVTTPTTAKVEVGFVYPAYIANATASLSPAFGRPGGTALFSLARMKGTWWKTSTIDMYRNLPASDFGQGWDLSIHHTMSPANPTVLMKGDGSIVRQDLRPLRGYAGGTPTVWVDFGCNPAGMAVDAAGNVFVSDTCVHRVLKIDRAGTVTTYAGRWEDRHYGGGFAGDGGPAANARLKSPTALAVDPAGNLYIHDSGNLRIRKVDTAGIITTVAGNGQSGSSQDGTAGVAARLSVMYGANGIALDNLGNLYFIDASARKVRKIGSDGLLTTVLSATYPDEYEALAVDREGNLYAAFRPWDVNSRSVIRRLSPDGRITTVAGGGNHYGSRDGILALQAHLNCFYGLSVGPDGSLYFITSSSTNDYDVLRIDPAGILRAVPKPWITRAVAFDPEGAMYALGSSGYVYKLAVPPGNQTLGQAGDFLFTEGGLGYLFSDDGRHKATVDLATRANLYTFGYDGDHLVSVTDRFGKTTIIQRDGSGSVTAIVLPDGRRTGLLAVNGRLERVTFPDSTGYVFGYDSSGLVREKWDPKGNHFSYHYDGSGRLENAQDPEGGQASWLRWTDTSGKTHTQIGRAEGTLKSFQETTGWDGSYTSVLTGADGSVRTSVRSADRSTETITSGCGLAQTKSYSLDPAWNYKYLREVIAKTPAGLIRKRTVSPSYQDTNGDLKADRVTTSITVNSKVTTLVDNTLTGMQTSTSPAGRVVTTTYDPATRLTQQVSTAGLLPTSFLYDAHGNLVESTVGARTTHLVYDAKDLLDHMTTADGQTYD